MSNPRQTQHSLDKEHKDDIPFLQERPVYRAIDLFPEQTHADPIFMTLAAPDVTRSSSLEQEVTRGTGPIGETLTVPSFTRQEFWTTSPRTLATAGALPSHSHKLLGQGTGGVNLGSARTAKSLSESVAQLAISHVEHAQPLEVPELPPFVEQWSSFITSREPRAVMQALTDALSDNSRVDFETSSRKAKISGVVYTDNSSCLFKIKIFQRREKDTHKRYVVEFQRRSGCVVAFSSFYQRTLQVLGPVVERPFATPTLSLPSLSSPPPALGLSLKPVLPATPPAALAPVQLQSGPGQVVLDDNTQQCLLDMASSKDSDVQREAMRFLACATTSPVNQARLANGKDASVPQLVTLCGNLIASKDKEVVRCSTTFVANLAQQPSVRPALLPLVPQLLHLFDLAVPSASVNALLFREVWRQIARILVALSASCKGELLKDGPARLTLMMALDKQRLAAASDDSLRPLIDTTLSNLGVAPTSGTRS